MVELATQVISKIGANSGVVRILVPVMDVRRGLHVPKLPTLYFDGVFEFRFVLADRNKILKIGESLDQDALKINMRGGEQLTLDEFNKRVESEQASQALREAQQIINPKNTKR